MKKICPFRTTKDFKAKECAGSNCELWTMAYTTENRMEYGCAFRINAMKNSDGRIEP